MQRTCRSSGPHTGTGKKPSPGKLCLLEPWVPGLEGHPSFPATELRLSDLKPKYSLTIFLSSHNSTSLTFRAEGRWKAPWHKVWPAEEVQEDSVMEGSEWGMVVHRQAGTGWRALTGRPWRAQAGFALHSKYSRKSQKSFKQGNGMILFLFIKIYLDAVWRINDGGGRQDGQKRDGSEAIKLTSESALVAWAWVASWRCSKWWWVG